MRSFLTALAIIASVAARAQSPALQRGELVRVLPGSLTSDTATALTLRVVAIPNDRVTIATPNCS
jgi:hypothetical protein